MSLIEHEATYSAYTTCLGNSTLPLEDRLPKKRTNNCETAIHPRSPGSCVDHPPPEKAIAVWTPTLSLPPLHLSLNKPQALPPPRNKIKHRTRSLEKSKRSGHQILITFFAHRGPLLSLFNQEKNRWYDPSVGGGLSFPTDDRIRWGAKGCSVIKPFRGRGGEGRTHNTCKYRVSCFGEIGFRRDRVFKEEGGKLLGGKLIRYSVKVSLGI